MSGPGLTLTQQPPLSPAATTVLDAPAGELWSRIADSDDVRDALEAGVCDLVGHLHPGQRALALEEHGVTALDGLFASAIVSVVSGGRKVTDSRLS